MARIACPNCGIPCTGCAGARLTKASDGTPCCTKCVTNLERQIQAKKTKPQ
jgi:coenzyme F420-reducing hydrogenase gamma subunit